MATTIKIKTRETRQQFIARLNRVIKQAVGDFNTPNGGIVAAHVADEVFRDNWKEFKKKSSGGSDRFGLKWDELTEETIRDKQSRNRGVQAHGFATSGVSRQGKKVPGITSRRRLGTKGNVLIGIDTTELAVSLRPGKLIGSRIYVPTKGQLWRKQSDSLTMGTLVVHAKFFNAARNIGFSARRSKEAVRRGVAKAANAIAKNMARGM